MRGISELKKTNYLPLVVGAGIFALGFVAMSAAGAKQSDSGANTPQEQGPLVEVTKAQITDGLYQVAAPGRLQARQELTLVAEVAGKVSYLNPAFVTGGRFEEGDVLFRINQADYMAELSRAEAGIKSAKATLTRAKLDHTRQLDLVKQGAVSESARDAAVANLANAEAGLMQAKAQLVRAQENFDRTTIKAPFPALVVRETVSEGTYVAPGQNLGTLIDTRAGELVAGLSPKQAAAVSRMFQSEGGQLTATARPNSGSVGSGELTGYIDQFSPAIDASSRSALVVAVFPGAFSPERAGQIFANDFMTLDITVSSRETVWQLPVGAVRKGNIVWEVKDGKLKRHAVNVVGGTETSTLVTSAESLDGTEIMITLLSEENDGIQVRPIKQRAVAAAGQE